MLRFSYLNHDGNANMKINSYFNSFRGRIKNEASLVISPFLTNPALASDQNEIPPRLTKYVVVSFTPYLYMALIFS